MSYSDSGLSGGSHSYRLTVTDPLGNVQTSPTVSISIQGSTGNKAPVAAFTTSANGLTGSVDASTSTDSDGSIAAYAWTFGDSTTGSGRTTSHTYASSGTYTVTLTLTDNQGATNSTSRSLTAGDPPAETTLAGDAFERTVTAGLGTDGALTQYAVRTISGMETTLQSQAISGAYAPGQQLQMRLQVTGTSPTTIRTKVWRLGAAEPASWHITVTDSSSALQAAGAVGLNSYISSAATNVPVVLRFDNLLVKPV